MSDELKRFKVTEEVDCSEEDSVLFRETLSEEDKILWDIVWNNGSPINIFIKWGWKIEDGYQALLDRFKRSIEINEIAKNTPMINITARINRCLYAFLLIIFCGFFILISYSN